MKRRDFLQAAGATPLVFAGDRHESLAGGSQEAERSAGGGGAKAVLITSAETPLARTLADGLLKHYRVRLTGRSAALAPEQFEYVPGRLEHDASTRALVRGMDAMVLAAETPTHGSEARSIDDRARCTYNLLQAASQEGVRVAVYLSSLEMMTGYDRRFSVDEDWRPLPTLRSGALADYLGEFTCREFAREGKLAVVVLRLGRLRVAEQTAGPCFDPLALDLRDAVQVVLLALGVALAEPARLGPWSVFHILSGSPQARFSSAKAQRILGYRPQSNG